MMSSLRVGTGLIAVVAFLALPASAFAQQVGVKAGLNFASLTPEEDEDPDISRRRGLIGGVWVRLAPQTGPFSFQAEGLFSEKGVRYDARSVGLDGDADVRFRYLEVPLLARADMGAANANARFFVVGGLAPAFTLSARGQGVIDGEEFTHDVRDQTEPFDLGVVGGVGATFGRALVEARYTHGLLRTNKDHNEPNDRVRNRVFSVMVGIRLR